MNVDVRVGVGGKWTRGVRRRDGHAANGNGSTGGSSVGSSKRGLRMGRGDMYGGTQGVHFVWVERREEASPKRLREAEREGEEMRLADKRLAPIYRGTNWGGVPVGTCRRASNRTQ